MGVSNYGPNQLQKIQMYLASRGVQLASVQVSMRMFLFNVPLIPHYSFPIQVQFSLLSTGKEQKELLNLCQSLNIRVLAYSPLGLGMLTGKYNKDKLPSGAR